MSGPTIHHGGRWTLGVLVGLPFAALATLILLVLSVLFFIGAWQLRGEDRNSSDLVDWRPSTKAILGGVGFLLLMVAFVGGMVAAYWPLQAQYHQYRQVDGTVDRVQSRLLSAGSQGGTNQKFVVIFRGSAQQFAIDDTRAALVKPGDHLTISCIRVYDYASTAGYDCKWGRP